MPIIMLTGLDDGESVERAFQVGATDFISKPINWTLLRFRIRYVLRSAQVMQELVRNKESLSSAQRIARLGSWEWFVSEGRVQRSAQYYRLFGQQAETFGASMEALLDHVYGPDRPMVQAALKAAAKGVGYQLDLPRGVARRQRPHPARDGRAGGRWQRPVAGRQRAGHHRAGGHPAADPPAGLFRPPHRAAEPGVLPREPARCGGPQPAQRQRAAP